VPGQAVAKGQNIAKIGSSRQFYRLPICNFELTNTAQANPFARLI